jgi:hypothetical protein
MSNNNNTRINNLFRQIENLRKQMSKANSRSPNKKANNGKANNGSGNKFISNETAARYREAKKRFPNRSGGNGKIKLRPGTARTTASKGINNFTRKLMRERFL